MIEINLLIKNIKELIITYTDDFVRGSELNNIKISKNVWIGSTDERISFIGYEDDFNKNCKLRDNAIVIDGSNFVVMPGFIDAHNHLPFAGTRQDEFRLKLQGVSYQEIAAKGGGIKGSVRRLREIKFEDLLKQSEKRTDLMLLTGTTTTEAKSGYGLDKDNEIKQLEVLRALNSFHPIDIVSTFLGAHEIPEEYKGRNKAFLEFLIKEVLPEVKEKNLAEFVDIFCENGYFSYEESEYYLKAAKDMGFKLKIHSDEFTSNNAAILATKLNAVSAEHLIAMTEEEIDEIAKSDVVSVFLPGVSFFLKMDKYAPAKEVIKKNGIISLSTDFNPGSSMISSMLFIFYLGIYKLGLTIEEAINATTINNAYAIRKHDEVGSIKIGKKMDILLLDIPDYSYLAYHIGINPIHTVIKSGEIVVNKHSLVY